MSVNLTRQELYDLVWSKPMMHAAKEFGISGVMLGRICRERHVPCPPRGYWAKLASKKDKKRPAKIPLPNLPIAPTRKDFDSLLAYEYKQREAARTDEFDPNDLNDPVRDPPPPFTESLDEFERRIESLMPKLVEPSKLKERHPIVQKLIDVDLAKAAAYKRKESWSSPEYQSEKGQLELNMLNAFFHNFEALGFTVSLRGKKYFRFAVSLLRHYKEFRVFISEHDPNYYFPHRRPKEKTTLKYCFSWDNSYDYVTKNKRYYEFDKFNLDCIKRVVLDLAVKDEREYRDRVLRRYEYAVQRRKEAIREHEQRIRDEAARKKRELEELLAKRINLMESAVNHMNQADRIRDLIEIMNSKANSHNKAIDGLEHWVGWAHHFADTIDPRHMSLDTFESWISKFKLKD